MESRIDHTEKLRRALQADINSKLAERKALETEHGEVWDSIELNQVYTVEGFLAPFVGVIRKADGKKGTLEFQHAPRFYFNFVKDDSISTL